MNFCTAIYGAQRMIPNASGDPLTFPGTFLVLSEMSQQLLDGLTFGGHIHVTLRINCYNFHDPLTFYLAPKTNDLSISLIFLCCAN